MPTRESGTRCAFLAATALAVMAAPALAEEPPAPDVSSAPLPHQASGRLRDHQRDEGAMRRLGNVLVSVRPIAG